LTVKLTWYRGLIYLIELLRSPLTFSTSILLISAVVFASVAMEFSTECMPLLNVVVEFVVGGFSLNLSIAWFSLPSLRGISMQHHLSSS